MGPETSASEQRDLEEGGESVFVEEELSQEEGERVCVCMCIPMVTVPVIQSIHYNVH